ncbi:MAG TPA: hypothetical protein VGL53_02085 [Bryobacteraceae bacterium]|jgi:predicted GH43/DUF377 family glycosyl hydrolase
MFSRLLLPMGSLLLLLSGCDSAVNFRLPAPTPSSGGALTLELVETGPAAVLEPRAPGEFDSVDVLNPSVFRGPDGKYWNLYSGFDGKTWRTGLAVSETGAAWTKKGSVLSPDPAGWEGDDYSAANGSALRTDDGEILCWYQAGRVGGRTGPQIGLARSRDGKTWTKSAAAVLRPGPYRSWDERGVADPYVIRAGGSYYLYYTGLDRAQRQQLGVARSSDGVHWEKSAANPVLALGDHGELEEGGLGEPAVFEAGGTYWMLYTGRVWDEQRRLGLARSPDGIHWTRMPGWTFAGREAWDAKVVCDPTVEVEPDGLVRVWFGGGDVASPDERLHGRIGVATFRVTNP